MVSKKTPDKLRVTQIEGMGASQLSFLTSNFIRPSELGEISEQKTQKYQTARKPFVYKHSDHILTQNSFYDTYHKMQSIERQMTKKSGSPKDPLMP